MASIRSGAIDTVEILLGALTLVIAAFSIAGMALAEAGRFAAANVAALGLALSLALLVWAWRRWRASAMAVARTRLAEWIGLGALVVAAVLLFRPVADASIEGGDGSMYLAIGQMVASTGGLRQPDAALALVPRESFPDLFGLEGARPPRLNYFPGGIQIGLDGRIEPNFFHLGPVWMAIFDALRPGAGADINPIFGVLSIAVVWAIARRLSGSAWAGVAAGALLVLNYGEIWFGRYPTAEMLTQAMVCLTLLFLLIVADGGPVVAAGIAGTAAGLAAFSRLDALLMVTAPLIALAVVRAFAGGDSRRGWRVFLGAAAAVTGYAVFHAGWFTGGYVKRVLIMMVPWKKAADLIGPTAIVATGVATWLAWQRGGPRVRRGIALGAGVAAIGAALVLALRAGSQLTGSIFFLLVPPAAAAVAIAGLAALFVRRQPMRALPLAIVFTVSALIFLQNPHDVTLMPMRLRRFVPVLLPLTFVLFAHALSILSRRTIGRIAALVILALAITPAAGEARLLLKAQAYEGVRAQVAHIAAAIPKGALTFFDAHSPSHLALAMRYGFERDSFEVTGSRGHDAIYRAATAALDRGRRVFVAVPPETRRPDSLTRADFGSLSVRPAGEFQLEFHTLDSSDETRLPLAPRRVASQIDLYEVGPAGAWNEQLPITFDIGSLDFGWLLSGFYGPETMQGSTVRWTNGQARVIIPPLRLPDMTLSLRCRLAAPVSIGVSLPRVAIDVNGAEAGSFQVTSGNFAEYRLTLSRAIVARLSEGGVLTLSTPTFVPADFAASSDRRRLGVALDWITLGL